MGPTVHWNSTWRCPLYSLTVWVIQGRNSWYTSWISSPWQPNTHFLNHLTLTAKHWLSEPSQPDNQTLISWTISTWQSNTNFLNHLTLTTQTFRTIWPWQPLTHFLNHLTMTTKHSLSESSYLDKQKYTFWTISPWQPNTHFLNHLTLTTRSTLSEPSHPDNWLLTWVKGKGERHVEEGKKAIKHIYN